MFYRIDGIADGDYGGLSAERFVALCMRTPAYQGVMAARAYQQQQDDKAAGETGPPDPDAVPDDIETTFEMEVA